MPHHRRRFAIIFAFVGAITYLIGLIAMIPAAAFIDENDRLEVGGTIWNGQAVVDATMLLDWDFSILSSIANFGWSADWHLTGGASDVTGNLTQAGDELHLENIVGQADGMLLDTLFPKLPLTCQFLADLRFEHLRLGGDNQQGLGKLQTGPVACSAKGIGMIPIDLPALEGDMVPGEDATSGALMTTAGQDRLIELRLSPEGSLSIWPTQIATRRLPFLRGQRYDTMVE